MKMSDYHELSKQDTSLNYQSILVLSFNKNIISMLNSNLDHANPRLAKYYFLHKCLTDGEFKDEYYENNDSNDEVDDHSDNAHSDDETEVED